MDNLKALINLVDAGPLRGFGMFLDLSDDMYRIEKQRNVTLAPVTPNKESI